MGGTHYRADIDGLRALAVLSVIAYHASPSRLPGGFIGVDIFFVISGYLITGIIHRGLLSGSFSFLEFYARRARRIFPALVVVLTAVIVAGWFILLPDELASLGRHIAAGAGFLSNILLYHEIGYFDVSSVYKPLLHLWSLGVEEQFYLVWPPLLILACRLRISALASVLVVCFGSFVLCAYMVPINASQAFYLPFTRFWELAAGGALAIAGPVSAPRFAKESLSLFAAALLIGSIVFIREDFLFPTMAIFPVIGSVLLLAYAPGTIVGKWVFSNPLARWIGLISYPLYLWHWPLISFPTIMAGDQPSRDVRILAIVAAFVLAAATYYFVERPIRERGRLYPNALGAFSALAVSAVAGLAFFASGGVPDRPAVRTLLEAQDLFTGPIWPYARNDDCDARYPVSGAENYLYWFCMVSGPEEPTVLLLGSSHANSHYPSVVSNPKMKGQVVLSIGACEPSWIDRADVTPSVENIPCTPARRADQQEAINKIIERGTIKLVIMDGLLSLPDQNYIVKLKKRIDFIESHGAKVMIFGPHLKSTYYIRSCFARPLMTPLRSCKELQPVPDPLWTDFKPLVDSISNSNPDVRFFNPNSQFCEGKQCSFIQDGLPILRDEYNHLSRHGSNLVDSAMLTDDVVKWAFGDN